MTVPQVNGFAQVPFALYRSAPNNAIIKELKVAEDKADKLVCNLTYLLFETALNVDEDKVANAPAEDAPPSLETPAAGLQAQCLAPLINTTCRHNPPFLNSPPILTITFT